jgi:hypothetical protein
MSEPVLRIRIRIHRIHMFLGLQDPYPDPLVRGMDPDPFITMQKSKKNLDSYYFVTLFDFLSLKNDVNVLQKVISRKNSVKKLFFAGILKVNDENNRIRIH